MSAIDTATATGATRATSTDAFSAMSSSDFVDIIFAELTNQDPLAPNETNDLLQQISSLQKIESDKALADRLEQIEHHNEITSSSALIGKIATGLNESGARVVGFVDSVSISREGATLNLNNGSRLPFANVDEVIDPTLFADESDGQTADDTDPASDPAPEGDGSGDAGGADGGDGSDGSGDGGGGA